MGKFKAQGGVKNRCIHTLAHIFIKIMKNVNNFLKKLRDQERAGFGLYCAWRGGEGGGEKGKGREKGKGEEVIKGRGDGEEEGKGEWRKC